MNFKQNSLFTRNTGYEEEPMESQGGVLAVWGSPSSGKTVVSVKLADYLARKRKNVLLIFADMTAPPLPCICASSDLEGEKSLGSILAATHVTENLIKKNCMFYRKNDYLSMIGMLKGENVFTYPPYDQTQAAELIEQARDLCRLRLSFFRRLRLCADHPGFCFPICLGIHGRLCPCLGILAFISHRSAALGTELYVFPVLSTTFFAFHSYFPPLHQVHAGWHVPSYFYRNWRISSSADEPLTIFVKRHCFSTYISVHMASSASSWDVSTTAPPPAIYSRR